MSEFSGILLCRTRKFNVLRRMTLREAALDVLTDSNVQQKAEKSKIYVKAWQQGVIADVTDAYANELPCPSEPKRPVSNDQITCLKQNLTDEAQAAETKRLKSMYKKNTYECTIHAIANAESYAVDLFWDLIARYSVPAPPSDASAVTTSRHVALPRDFYDNMTYIANQEAEHFLAWYHRLEELGYPFGTFPLSNGLWQSAGDTSGNLLARLAIINLTHEAKGLDSYAYTKEKFVTAKDAISLQILDHNFQEEIFHVASGLRWFKYACHEHGVDPIDTFHSLSRQYFKGKLKPPFNTEARNTAGLTEDWYVPLT